MLQPTSCGPGPPDEIFEYNKNEMNEKQQQRQQQQQQQQHLQQQLENNENYQRTVDIDDVDVDDNYKYVVTDNNVDDDDDEYGLAEKMEGKQQQQQQNEIMKFITKTTNSTNNKNCHSKNLKYSLNKPTAAAIVTRTTAKTRTTLLQATKSTTSTMSNNSCCNFTTVAAQQKQKLQQDEKLEVVELVVAEEDIVTHEQFSKCCFLTTPTAAGTVTASSTSSSSALANVANNFNKFYCNFTSSLPKTTTTAIASSPSSSCTTTSIKWILMFLMLFTILAQSPHQVAAEKSKHYYMQSLCKNHFLQQLYRKIDGAVLWSQNERNLDCIITFQTHSILQRFMLRFDMLQLDCNDHLYIYDGAHAVATPKIDISCRQTKQTVSSILTRTNFVTLKYVTDNWGTDANGFKLVITSVKDPKHTCKDFTCGSNGFCIHPDLLCDGINHCSDNSDESVHNLCQSETSSTVFGMDMTWFVMIVVSILLILSAAIVAVTICVCRRQEETNNQQNTAIQLHHNLAETNGSSKHLHYTHGGTLTREHTQLPPTSGNWHHPAGPYTGYHRIQHNYLKMATKVRPIWCLANFVN